MNPCLPERATRARLVVAFGIALLTALVYLPSLDNAFVNWDDDVYVYENPHIRTMSWAFLKWALTDRATAGFWHPVVWVSYAIDYRLWGMNAFGYHLSALVLHCANTLLVVWVIGRLLDAAGKSAPSRGPRSVLVTAGAAGILFGLHPLHVESVAWISERKDLWCALFFLLSINAYIGYAASGKKSGEGSAGPEPGNAPRPFYLNTHYVFSFMLFILALASKSMAVTLPVVLLILDWYPLRRWSSPKGLAPLFIEKLPFLAMSAIVSLVSIASQHSYGTLASLDSYPLSVRLPVAVKAAAAYLWKMAVPVDLLPYYPYPANASFADKEVLFATALLLTTTLACLALARKKRVWLALWGYYLVTLLPVSGIVKVGQFSMADRYTYLPSLGPFVGAGLAAAWLWKKTDELGGLRLIAKAPALSVAMALCAVMALTAVKQINVWQDGISLWSHVIGKEPKLIPFAYDSRANAFRENGQSELALADHARAIALDGKAAGFYNNRGVTYREAGQPDRSVDDHTAAIALQPGQVSSYNNRGLAYREQGRFELAMDDFRKALELEPSFADAYVSRGWTYEAMGRPDLAMDDYTKAIGLNPYLPIAFNNRGMLYLGTGRQDLALEDFTRAVSLDPTFAEAYTNRGLAHEQTGKDQAAFEDYTSAIKANSSFASAYNNRALLYDRAGRFEPALADLDTAIRLNPGFVEAYNNRGLVLEDMGRFDKAVEDYGAAIRLKPDDYIAYISRGTAYSRMKRYAEAAADHSKAISLRPDLAKGYLERGRCYMEMGKVSLAREDFGRACRMGSEEGCSLLRTAAQAR